MTHTSWWKKAGYAVLGIVVLVVGLALIAGHHRYGYGGYGTAYLPQVQMIEANCSLSGNDASASYSATITAPKDFAVAADAAKNILTGHGGEILSTQSYSQQYPDSANLSVNVNSVTVSGVVPIDQTDALMQDVKKIITASEKLNESYTRSTARELMTQCINARNDAMAARSLGDYSLSQMPTLIKAAAYNSSSTFSDLFSSVNGQIQSLYSQTDSANSNIATVLDSVNKMSVSITVQDRETPQYQSPYWSNSYSSSSSQGIGY